MKIKDLRNYNDDDLVAKEKNIKKELFDMNNQAQFGKVEKPASFRNLRRDIAKILTVLNERKNNGKKR